jgi:hypothetical protein
MDYKEYVDMASQLHKDWVWDKGVCRVIDVDVNAFGRCEVIIVSKDFVVNVFTFYDGAEKKQHNAEEWGELMKCLKNWKD